MTLQDYIKKRNGVPMGASHSMRNMLHRSLGAGDFAAFWRYWNPVWGYYLGSYIYKPLQKFLPVSICVILTFLVSGLIHDAAAMLVRREISILFTSWFLFMGLGVMISKGIGLNYAAFPWVIRASFNLLFIGASCWLAYQFKGLFPF